MTDYKLLNYPLLSPLSRFYDKLSPNSNKHNVNKENPRINYKNYDIF